SRTFRFMVMLPVRIRPLTLLLVGLSLSATVHGDVTVPNRAGVNSASLRRGYTTIWPADPPCGASEGHVTAWGFYGPVLWSNDHGGGLQLRGSEAPLSSPAALRRAPPTHLPLDPDDVAVAGDVTLKCDGFELRWFCNAYYGKCHRYEYVALDP